MADHGELAFARLAAMDVAVASAHRTLSRTKIRTRNIDKRLTEGRVSGLIANKRRKDVAFLEKQSARDTDSLLATPDVNAAANQPAAIKTCEFVFERSRQQHPAKGS